jgi:hypothetical protein
MSISKRAPGELIVRTLRQSLPRKPRALRAAVWPYVALVALSKKPNVAFLREAARLPAPFHPWYQFLAQVLLRDYQPTEVLNMDLRSPSLVVQSADVPTPSQLVAVHAK